MPSGVQALCVVLSERCAVGNPELMDKHVELFSEIICYSHLISIALLIAADVHVKLSSCCFFLFCFFVRIKLDLNSGQFYGSSVYFLSGQAGHVSLNCRWFVYFRRLTSDGSLPV